MCFCVKRYSTETCNIFTNGSIALIIFLLDTPQILSKHNQWILKGIYVW